MARVPVQTEDEEDVIQDDMPETEVAESSEESETRPTLTSRLASSWPPKISTYQALALATALLLLIFGAFLINDRKQLQNQVEELKSAQINTDDQANNQAEAEELKSKVSEFVELPVDETPTVATVVDASKVREQPFFANAKNGDKVLIFARAGKAILYRPTTDKIIEISPINLGGTPTKSNQNTAQ